MFLLLLSIIFAYFFYLFFWGSELLEIEGAPITILSNTEVIDLLVYNPRDNYYDSLSVLDLKARGVSAAERPLDAYLRKIETLLTTEPIDSSENKKKIIECIDSMELLRSVDTGDLYDWVDKERWCALPWKIAIVPGGFEYGFPHTRGDVIVIPGVLCEEVASQRLANTLLHERLHVYQKMYPDDFQKYLDSQGFVRYCRRKDIQNVAANPDADEWVYMKDGEVFVGQYASSDPVGAKSIVYKPVNSPRYDCPQEYCIHH